MQGRHSTIFQTAAGQPLLFQLQQLSVLQITSLYLNGSSRFFPLLCTLKLMHLLITKNKADLNQQRVSRPHLKKKDQHFQTTRTGILKGDIMGRKWTRSNIQECFFFLIEQIYVLVQLEFNLIYSNMYQTDICNQTNHLVMKKKYSLILQSKGCGYHCVFYRQLLLALLIRTL